MQPPEQRHRAARERAGNAHRACPEDLREPLPVEHRLGGQIERAADLAREGRAVGLGDVVGVHRLEAQAGNLGDQGNEARPEQRGRQQRAREEPPDPGRRRSLEDQPRAHAHDPDRRVLALEDVEPTLDLGLVTRVEARRHPADRPALVDEAVFRTRRVRADR